MEGPESTRCRPSKIGPTNGREAREAVPVASAATSAHILVVPGCDFPELDFARKAVAPRCEDRKWLKGDEFANEQAVLEQFRLIVHRPMNETADKQVTVMRFRHDKVMDVLTKRAFEEDKKLQIELAAWDRPGSLVRRAARVQE